MGCQPHLSFGKGRVREMGEAPLGQKGVCSAAGTDPGMISLFFFPRHFSFVNQTKLAELLIRWAGINLVLRVFG